MNPRFHFRFFCPRVNHDDTYRLNIHEEGWHVDHISIGGKCDKRADPYLYRNLDHDHVQYPSGLGFEMELLFEHARDKTLPDEEIQRRLDELARWVERVNAVEQPVFE